MNQLRPKRCLPIDWADLHRQTGLRAGTVAKHGTLGVWGVFNTRGLDGPSFTEIEPPELREGETELRIEENHWCFYGPYQFDTDLGKAMPDEGEYDIAAGGQTE